MTCALPRKLISFLIPLAFSLSADASESFTSISNDNSTVTVELTINGPATISLYVDADNNLKTGYSSGLGLGMDRLIAGGILHNFEGAEPGIWQWSKDGTPVSYVYNETTKRAKWVLPLSLLGSSTALKVAAEIHYVDGPTAFATRESYPLNPNAPALLRDPLKQPFASNSIWNRPIGTGVTYEPAMLPTIVPAPDNWAVMPQIDSEQIVLRPDAPLLDIKYSGVAWSGGDRCVPTGGVLATVPVPDNFVVSSSRDNNPASFLQPDRRTVIQGQPFTRCTAGPGTDATWLQTLPPVDLYGPGITGGHGGSNLSGLGGSIRMGELRPNADPLDFAGPRHALKLNVDPKQALTKCATPKACYVWPATTADNGASGTNGNYGKDNPNSDSSKTVMGSLLAIPYSVDLSTLLLETGAGKQLAWTLQNYGAYIVDSTGGPGYAFSAEVGPDGDKRVQFEEDWKLPMQQWVASDTAWSRDVARIIAALQRVSNNADVDGPAGGGRPLQPFLPELPN